MRNQDTPVSEEYSADYVLILPLKSNQKRQEEVAAAEPLESTTPNSNNSTIWVADWFAKLNNNIGGDLKEIEELKERRLQNLGAAEVDNRFKKPGLFNAPRYNDTPLNREQKEKILQNMEDCVVQHI
ncbi:unnamed protein product [Vicia faba]|uniref:Uncharacterized protein n=1 Tax=Vicia faba TaxID=3906 RepID=A0AAV0YM83_VICFA|nr:unnamed protein product [Vicia faba]